MIFFFFLWKGDGIQSSSSKVQSSQTVLRKINMITHFPKGNLKHKEGGEEEEEGRRDEGKGEERWGGGEEGRRGERRGEEAEKRRGTRGKK